MPRAIPVATLGQGLGQRLVGGGLGAASRLNSHRIGNWKRVRTQTMHNADLVSQNVGPTDPFLHRSNAVFIIDWGTALDVPPLPASVNTPADEDTPLVLRTPGTWYVYAAARSDAAGPGESVTFYVDSINLGITSIGDAAVESGRFTVAASGSGVGNTDLTVRRVYNPGTEPVMSHAELFLLVWQD